MENFFQKNLAISKRYNSILASLALALVVLVLLGGLYFWFYHRPRSVEVEQPEAQAQKTTPTHQGQNITRGTIQQTQPQTTTAEGGATAGTVTAGTATAGTATAGTATAGTANASTATTGGVTAVPGGTAGASPASTQESNLNIRFILLGHELIDRLSQDGEGHLEVGRYSMSIVPNIKSKVEGISSEKNFSELGADTRDLTVSQPSLVFRGGKEPKSNEAIGFFVEVTPTRNVDKSVEYKLSIKRSLPDAQPGEEVKVTSQPFDESVIIPNGSAAIIAGLLPRKTILEGEEALYQTNILKALLDPAFQKGESEFIIIVSPNLSP